MGVQPLDMPRLVQLPESMPPEGAVNIAIVEGVPVFRASEAVVSRIESLLAKQREAGLSADEEEELDRYAAVDDYLSFVNRALRDMSSETHDAA